MKSVLTFILILVFSVASMAVGSVRSVIPKEDEIIQIRTAMGIATLIQMPEAIQSAIIGDQTAFRLEPLDKSVTVKPLRYGAKTNLYLLADKKRYNLKLTTLNPDVADYIVYIKESQNKVSLVRWSLVNAKKEDDYKTVIIKRIGHSQGGFLLVEGEIRVSGNSAVTLKPENFWIRQNKDQKTINSLYISDTKVSKNQSVQFGLSIAKTDLSPKTGLIFEYGDEKKLSFSFQESVVWR